MSTTILYAAVSPDVDTQQRALHELHAWHARDPDGYLHTMFSACMGEDGTTAMLAAKAIQHVLPHVTPQHQATMVQQLCQLPYHGEYAKDMLARSLALVSPTHMLVAFLQAWPAWTHGAADVLERMDPHDVVACGEAGVFDQVFCAIMQQRDVPALCTALRCALYVLSTPTVTEALKLLLPVIEDADSDQDAQLDVLDVLVALPTLHPQLVVHVASSGAVTPTEADHVDVLASKLYFWEEALGCVRAVQGDDEEECKCDKLGDADEEEGTKTEQDALQVDVNGVLTLAQQHWPLLWPLVRLHLHTDTGSDEGVVDAAQSVLRAYLTCLPEQVALCVWQDSQAWWACDTVQARAVARSIVMELVRSRVHGVDTILQVVVPSLLDLNRPEDIEYDTQLLVALKRWAPEWVSMDLLDKVAVLGAAGFLTDTTAELLCRAFDDDTYVMTSEVAQELMWPVLDATKHGNPHMILLGVHLLEIYMSTPGLSDDEKGTIQDLCHTMSSKVADTALAQFTATS